MTYLMDFLWWPKKVPNICLICPLAIRTWEDVESVELMTMSCLIRNSFLYQLQFPPVPHSNALISLPPTPWVVLCPAENSATQGLLQLSMRNMRLVVSLLP